MMIERREFVGLTFEKCATEHDFEEWCRANGFESVEQFERETFITFAQIVNRWFFITRSEGHTTVYARSVSGLKVLLGERQRHRG